MLRAMILAITLSLASSAAMAGQVTVTLSPSTPEEAAALRLGITLYALTRQQSAAGVIRQSGRNNLALLSQSGTGSVAVLRQRGNGHQARIQQSGQGLGAVVIQSGKGAVADISQTGSAGPVILLQHGW